MAEDKKKDDKEEEIVMVGENGEIDETGKEKPPAKVEKKKEEIDDEDEKDESDDEESEEGKEPERLGHTDTEEEERRESRRKERQQTKVRRREARDRNQRELSFLRQRNEQLERRFSHMETRTGQNELAAVDSRINQIRSSIKTAEDVMADAVKKQSGEDLVEATKIRDDLRDNLSRLNQAKTQLEQQSRQTTPSVDPVLRVLADEWRSKNTWWQPGGTDRDSKIVAAIDGSLSQNGYDPTTDEYWEELSKRVRQRLPHRYKTQKREEVDDELDDEDDEEETPQKRNGKGPRFATGGRTRPLGKNQVYVNPERIAALKELGAWDDPVLRKRYLKKYQEWDREHGATRN